MIAGLVAALLVLAGAYVHAMWRAAVSARPALPGRHRLSPKHAGWETAVDELHALQRARGSR